MLLEAKELVKKYTRGGSSFSAVDGVSLTVDPEISFALQENQEAAKARF